MRVIAGLLGGRQFDSPKKSLTHPMSEKMRGAIFSTLGELDGLSVLDVYSGSGALAIEAYSRGAVQVVAIDSDKTAVTTIRSNLTSLQIPKQSIKVIQARIEGWLNTSSDCFDIIIADPPYEKTSVDVLKRLIHRLNSPGLMVLSWPGKEPMPELGELVKSMDYGDSRLGFFSLG